jgi:hypothetical protein
MVVMSAPQRPVVNTAPAPLPCPGGHGVRAKRSRPAQITESSVVKVDRIVETTTNHKDLSGPGVLKKPCSLAK